MEQWQLALVVIGLVFGAVSGAFTLGRMWPRAAKPKDSGTREAVAPDFEERMRIAMESLRDTQQQMMLQLADIKAGMNSHPTWKEFQEYKDEAAKNREELRDRLQAVEGELKMRRAGDKRHGAPATTEDET